MESGIHNTIGERLQQTRKKLGFSIDDVADGLKVRRELLKNLEANEFDCGLPRVYTRGFLKSYAKHLKLNPSGILKDFDELYSGTTKINKFSLGQLKFADEEHVDDDSKQSAKAETIDGSAKYVKPVPQFVYFRWLIIAAALLICAAIGVGIIKWMRSTKQAAVQAVVLAEKTLMPIKFCVVATDRVQVFIRNEADKQRIFSGTLNKGERKEIESVGNVQLSYSDGANLYVEKSDGAHVKPSKVGRGWLRI